MLINVSAPPVDELEDFTIYITTTNESSPTTGPVETEAVISITPVTPLDSGVTITEIQDPEGLAPSGEIVGPYLEQFSQRLGYAVPQVDELTPPEKVFVKTWAEVPTPDQTEEIWYLFEFTPPPELTTIASYNIRVDYLEDLSVPPELPDPQPAFVETTVHQVVNYNIDQNTAKFKEYYPDPDPIV